MDTDTIHQISDLAGALARSRRTMTDAARMLDDALYALRNGSPHVTDEFIDRTMTALRDRISDVAEIQRPA